MLLFTWPFLSSLKGSLKLEIDLVFKSGGFFCRFVKKAEYQNFIVADMSYLMSKYTRVAHFLQQQCALLRTSILG